MTEFYVHKRKEANCKKDCRSSPYWFTYDYAHLLTKRWATCALSGIASVNQYAALKCVGVLILLVRPSKQLKGFYERGLGKFTIYFFNSQQRINVGRHLLRPVSSFSFAGANLEQFEHYFRTEHYFRIINRRDAKNLIILGLEEGRILALSKIKQAYLSLIVKL